MSQGDKLIWRCHCGKRVEVLTDDNFGDCGCSDPVYGPEWFRMTEAVADVLDEMTKDYDTLYREHEELKKRDWKLSPEQQKEFKKLARPLMCFLSENADPHSSILITSTDARVVTGVCGFHTEDYVEK